VSEAREDYEIVQLQKEVDRTNDALPKKMDQLSTWLVVGNGAGLVFLLTAARDEKLIGAIDYSRVYLAFIIGTGAAVASIFFGAIFAISRYVIDSFRLERLVDRKARRGSYAPPLGTQLKAQHDVADEKAFKTLQKLRGWLILTAPIGIGLDITSIVCLGIGVITPLQAGVFS
jgi:hypothetical protein